MEYSIIIPTRNEGMILKATIDNLVDASKKLPADRNRPNDPLDDEDYEIIVIDDDSNDYSVEDVIDAYSDNERITIIRNEKNLGVAASRNRGAALAKGDVLIFMDAHTFVPDHWLARIHSEVHQHNDDPYAHTLYTAVIGDIYGAPGSMSPAIPPDEGEETLEYHYFYSGPMLIESISHLPAPVSYHPVPIQLQAGMFAVIGREYFNEVGGWDAGMAPPGAVSIMR